MRVDHYFHDVPDKGVQAKLDLILAKLGIIQQLEEHEMADLAAITASVAQAVTVEESAVTLLQEISAALAAAGTDPAALADLQSQLDAGTADLAAAITANTPAAP